MNDRAVNKRSHHHAIANDTVPQKIDKLIGLKLCGLRTTTVKDFLKKPEIEKVGASPE